MNKKKSIVLALAIAVVFLIAAAGSASAGCIGVDTGTDYGCGDTVTESCTFNGNISCTDTAKPGLEVGADGIIINGAGHTITGNRENSGCGDAFQTGPAEHSGIVNTEYDNVVIKNLEIENFCTGIALYYTGSSYADKNTVTDCEIHNCGNFTAITHGIHLLGVNNCTITKNRIYYINGTGPDDGCGGGGNGIFLHGVIDAGGDGNNITYNNLSYNEKSGFFTKFGCMHNNISNNIATGNVEGGIVLMCKKSNYNTIENNDASGNTYYGIYIGGSNNTIINNIANNNGYYGIHMARSDGSYDNELYENTACGNVYTDIRTCGQECYGNHGDNNTCNTASDYCDDSAGCPPPCVYACPEECEIDLDVTYKDETWHNATHYNVNYKITNKGSLTSVATNTSISIDGTEVDRQSCPALAPNAVFTGTSGPHPVDNTVAVNGATYIDEIEVSADVDYDDPRDCDRTNNNETNIFGGPDLLITDFHEVWIDPSWKTYNLSYTVKNVGDIATTDDCWTNFTELEGEWSNCIDPVPISAGLAVGASETHIAGPFVMEGDLDWLQAWVNFNYTCPVNEWNELHHDRTRFCPGYADSGGCCDKCGDVYIDTFVDSSDIGLLRQKVSYGATLDCNWAGDVYCDGLVDSSDIGLLRQKVSYGATLNCCKGCE